MWKVIDSEKRSASDLMLLDAKLLADLGENDPPTIHFYDFIKPSFTFGVFIDPSRLMDQGVYEKNFDFSKRPTGGGVLFHQWDFAFSCLVPKNHPAYLDDVISSYKYINERIVFALKEFIEGEFSLQMETMVPEEESCKHFCFSKPTRYDIMLEGKKIAGAAQRRVRNGYLHQGSIALITPEYFSLEPLFPKESKVLTAMKQNSTALLGPIARPKDRLDVLHTIKQNIASCLD